MAGIYIHIPFCKQACHYCNFHFSTSNEIQDQMVTAICEEIKIRAKDYQHELRSIYLGGGTPSLLNEKQLNNILSIIRKEFVINPTAELTLEANPDDLNLAYLKMLHGSGINRLSIGVQSFFDEDLKWMNRAHNAAEAYASIDLARQVGIDNMSIDLIFGSPSTSHDNWKANLAKAIQLEIPHLSCYGLTVEPGTALEKMIELKKKAKVSSKLQSEQFDITMNELNVAGYEHYEISNYGLPGKHAVHNSNYWKGLPYLGVGPSAHSYDGKDRYFNVSNNLQYLKSISEGNSPLIKDKLSNHDRYNEYVMTGLRTSWGCNLNKIELIEQGYASYFKEHIQEFIEQDLVLVDVENNYTLSNRGKHFADLISSQVFMV